MKSSTKIYKISEPGESFWSISVTHNIDYHELLELNKRMGKSDKLPVYPDRTPAYGVQIGDNILLPFDENDVSDEQALDQTKKTSLPKRNDEKLKNDKASVGSITNCVTCNFYELSVKCGNSKRKYTHTVDTEAGPNQVFQVIAGGEDHAPNEDFDTLKIGLNVDDCQNGHPTSICGHAKLSDGSVILDGKTAKVYAAPPSFKNDDFTTFMEKYLIPNSHPKRYQLKGQSCDSGGRPVIDIECFSPTKWEGELNLGYFHEEYKNTYKRIKKQGYWGLEGGLIIELGDKKFSIGSPTGLSKVDRNSKLTEQVFSGVQKFLNKTTPFLSEIKSDYASIKVLWPKLKLKGSLSNVEVANSPNVDLKGGFGVYMDPLIGATFTVDILNIIIAAAGSAAGSPAFAKLLIKIKKEAAKGIGEGDISAKANIELLFTISGIINGELSWDFDPPEKNTIKGGLEGKVPIQIEGKAEVEFTAFWVSAGAGAKVGAKTGFGAALKPGWSSKDGAFVGGNLSFDGITLYYAVYTNLNGGARKSALPTSRPETPRGGGKHENIQKFVWVKPAKWPSDSDDSTKKVSLTNGQL